MKFLLNFYQLSGDVHPSFIKLESQPRGIAASADCRIVVVACQKSVAVFLDQKCVFTNNNKYESTCVAVTPDAKLIAVGGQVIMAIAVDFTLFDIRRA